MKQPEDAATRLANLELERLRYENALLKQRIGRAESVLESLKNLVAAATDYGVFGKRGG